jgi:hypothetical protein
MDKSELLEEIRLAQGLMIPRQWWKMAEELAAEKKISLGAQAINGSWRRADPLEVKGPYK